MSYNQMSFRSMGSHSSKGERLMEILHQTCCLQDYSLALGFQVRKTGLSVWEKYSVKTRAVASWKSTFLRPFTWQIQGKLSFNRGKQLFILGTFFFFFKVFSQVIQKQDHSRSTIGALKCNSNSMWTTLTSSGDAVTFDSHWKTP